MVSVEVGGVTEALVEGTAGVGCSVVTIGGGAVNGEATGPMGVVETVGTTNVCSDD